MSNLQKKLQDILKSLQTSDVRELKRSAEDLYKLRKIPPIQKQANSSAIDDIVPKIIVSLSDSIDDNLNLINNQNLRSINEGLREFQNWIPKRNIDAVYLSKLQSIRNQVSARIRGKQQKQNENNVERRAINNLILNNLKSDAEITSFQMADQPLKLPVKPVGGSAIQEQLTGIVDILDNPPPSGIIQASQLPPTMNLLAQYSAKLGYKPIGTLTGSKGRSYVGLSTQMQQGQQIYKNFPSIGYKGGSTPSIKQTFRYHAGETIRAWNNYVASQEKFIDFAQSVSSKQKRQTFVRQQIKGMNTQNYAAQSLATFCYYYLYNPLKWMINKFAREENIENPGQQWFFDNYQFAPGIGNNPLFLTTQQIKKCFDKILTEPTKPGKASAILQSLNDLIEGFVSTKYSIQNFNKFKGFAVVRVLQARSYLKTIGLSNEKTKKVLDNQNIVGLIYKKIVFPSLYTNPEIMLLIDTALKKKEKQQNNFIQHWTLEWGSQLIPAYDYIWGKQ